MASARIVAITVVSVTSLVAAAIAALAGWFVLAPSDPGLVSRRAGPPGASARVLSKALPPGYVRMKIGGVAPTPGGNAVVLTEASQHRGLLIFVGGTEGLSIALRLQKRKYSRPLTHDLLDGLLREVQGQVLRAQVDRLEDGVYFGTLLIDQGERVVRLDARPSDALALAVGSDAPIYVARKVLDVAGVALQQIELQTPDEIDPEAVLQDDRSGQVEL